MNKTSISIGCFILIFVASVAMATSATTQQMWTFDDADNPAQPESFTNSYGIPMANLSTTGDLNYFGWLDVVDSRQGVWAGEPLQIELIIHNNPLPNAYKEIWLEMDFMQTLDSIEVIPSPVNGSSVIELSRDISLPDSYGWKTLNIGWEIIPNPNEEKICIGISGTGGYVDYITVDTICIPEPATVMLLGLGTLALLTRKRK